MDMSVISSSGLASRTLFWADEAWVFNLCEAVKGGAM